ncbi:hypothetical protein [Pollutibacter soli]
MDSQEKNKVREKPTPKKGFRISKEHTRLEHVYIIGTGEETH